MRKRVDVDLLRSRTGAAVGYCPNSDHVAAQVHIHSGMDTTTHGHKTTATILANSSTCQVITTLKMHHLCPQCIPTARPQQNYSNNLANSTTICGSCHTSVRTIFAHTETHTHDTQNYSTNLTNSSTTPRCCNPSPTVSLLT